MSTISMKLMGIRISLGHLWSYLYVHFMKHQY